MMETLDKHNVKATFFMTGGFVSDNPECVKTLVEKGMSPEITVSTTMIWQQSLQAR